MTDSSLQEIVCCIGQPVAGNPTQFMMERAIGAAGLDWRFLTLEVAPSQLEDAVRGMRALGFKGASVSEPHKPNVAQFLDGVGEQAGLVGNVNCIRRQGDELIGENTQGPAFLDLLREFVAPSGAKAFILGAGGAARAIAVELARAGVLELTIANRSPERGQQLVELVSERLQVSASWAPWDDSLELDDETRIVVNATPLGEEETDAGLPFSEGSLRGEMVVADVVFNPPQTRLLRIATARGCKTLDGLGMFVAQNAIAFETWTGVKPDSGIMREALEEFLEL